MIEDSLTPEQKSFANHNGEAFVEACPGAGKTRTIVARLANIAKEIPPRRAVAILSFTNSAVEKFSESCRKDGLAMFLHYPHFVGTLDAFVRHFIILPSGISASAYRPIIVDSWDSIGIEIRLLGGKSFSGAGVSLDKFDPETGLVDIERVGFEALRKHIAKYKKEYEQEAKRRRAFLQRSGYFSAGDARNEAHKRIENVKWSKALASALGSRFYEIIVDEAQDCNPLDIEILSWLRDHGLRVTVVCDPDQAIYEFRHGTPSNLRKFAEFYEKKNQLKLTGNFRSSNPICLLSATLRSRKEPDRPLGETAKLARPVVLLTYAGRTVPPQVGELFVERLETKAVGIHRTRGIILAHQLRDAQRAIGDPVQAEPSGTSRIETMARAVGEFWSSSATSRSRESILRIIEKLLLQLMGHWKDGEDHYSRRVIERAGLSQREIRRQALEVVMNIPKICDDSDRGRDKWIESVHASFSSLQLVTPKGNTVKRFFPPPHNGKWSVILRVPTVKSLVCSTIHEAKGREYEAVCVVLKPDRVPENHTSKLFDAWENRTDLEAKRVIYVGVTRARQFVMLAVPDAFGDRCAAIFDQARVPYERVKSKKNSSMA